MKNRAALKKYIQDGQKDKCKSEDSYLKSLWGLKANMTYLRSGESLNLWEKIFAINARSEKLLAGSLNQVQRFLEVSPEYSGVSHDVSRNHDSSPTSVHVHHHKAVVAVSEFSR